MIIDWIEGTPLSLILEQVVPDCNCIAEWFGAPDMEISVQAYTDSRNRLFVIKDQVGGLSFQIDEPSRITLHPSTTLPIEEFRQYVVNDWLAALLPFQGLQTLHASAVQLLESGAVIAFCAHSGTGKSTLAYGLGQSEGWQHFADDSLTLVCNGQRVEAASVRSEIRLRAPSAAYFAVDQRLDSIPTQGQTGSLLAIYDLMLMDESMTDSVRITPRSGLQAYPILLQHAYALTLAFPELNRRMMVDYLCISRAIPVFELAFRHNFDEFDHLIRTVRAHIRSLIGA